MTVTMVRARDEILLHDALTGVVSDLVGDGDRTLLVDEVLCEEDHVGPLVDAASTPPFLTDRRIVLGRNIERFGTKEAVAPLVAYLEAPLDTTELVLEWSGGGRVPKSLTEAIGASGGQILEADPGRRAGDWIDGQLRAAELTLTGPARQRLVGWLGENVNRLPGLLATLETALGPGARVGPDELEPFLGAQEGGVPPWDLTDAVDRGDIPGALDALQRMLGGGGRHPLQVLATLHTHLGRILALDGADVRSEKEAAELLGMRGSSFPAKKALAQARRLGHDRVVESIALLAEADLDVRGQKEWPDGLTLEVLVARLARLNR